MDGWFGTTLVIFATEYSVGCDAGFLSNLYEHEGTVVRIQSRRLSPSVSEFLQPLWMSLMVITSVTSSRLYNLSKRLEHRETLYNHYRLLYRRTRMKYKEVESFKGFGWTSIRCGMCVFLHT